MVESLKVGQRIRIEQTIARREGDWKTSIEGEIVFVEEQPTGSWFAHSKDQRLWLKRIGLRKADGSLTTVSVDQHSRVEMLEGTAGQSS
jgi:hypothetical protein